MLATRTAGDFHYDVSLRIRHPSLSPDDISKTLSLVATAGWAAGSPRKHIDGGSSRRPTSYWSARLAEENSTALGASLQQACRMLQFHSAFLQEIVSTGGRLEFFVGWFSGTSSGEVLSHVLLRDIAELEIDLALDVYGSPSDVPVTRDDR